MVLQSAAQSVPVKTFMDEGGQLWGQRYFDEGIVRCSIFQRNPVLNMV